MHTSLSTESFEIIQQDPQEVEWRNAQRLVTISQEEELIFAARAELRFLHLVHCTPALLNPDVLERAVDRYFYNWLPLVCSFSDSPDNKHSLNCYLLPPLDCAWIWHCHKLNPVLYQTDCERIFKKVLDVKPLPGEEPPDSELRKYAERYSIKKWQTAYVDSREPYHFVKPLDDSSSAGVQEQLAKKQPRTNAGRLRHDLIDAAQRQVPFHYQVSEKWFWDRDFLSRALKRYKGFLYLIKKTQDSPEKYSSRPFFVPTYDIDLLWHSHQLSPTKYSNDTLKLFGRVLDHDDKDQDRGEGQKLNTRFTQTCKIWWDTYGRVYEQAGAMYRGPSPVAGSPAPSMTDLEQTKFLEFTNKGQWNSESFDKNLKFEYNELKAEREDSRSIMQVNLVVVGAKNVPKSSDATAINRCYVRVKALKESTFRMLNVSTQMKDLDKPRSQVQWNEGLCMEVESSIEGLRLELMRSKFRPRARKGNSSLMGCLVPWNKVGGSSTNLSTDSNSSGKTELAPFGAEENLGFLGIPFTSRGMSVTKWSPPLHGKEGPQIHYHISLTPAVVAPRIFRHIQSPVTDDNCQIIASRLYDAPTVIPGTVARARQVGRWTTKIIVNHTGEEKFTVRTRSEEVFNVHNAPQNPPQRENTVIHVHTGGYKKINEEILGSARQLMESEYHIENKNKFRHWSLFDYGAILAVHKPSVNVNAEPTIKIYGNFGSHSPMRLIPGARLEFEQGNYSEPNSSITLVRYTKDAPLGKATALINFRAASVVVFPGESVVLVLLINAAICKSFFDFEPTHALNPSLLWKVNSITAPKLGVKEGGHIGAAIVHRKGLSSRWKMIQCSTPDARNPLFDRWHTSGYTMGGTVCAAAACAGAACGGNSCTVVTPVTYGRSGRGGGYGGGGGGTCGGGGGGGGGGGCF